MHSKTFSVFYGLLVLALLGGCASLSSSPQPTPLPVDFLPTAAALTLEASGISLAHPTLSPTQPPTLTAMLEPPTPMVTSTKRPTATRKATATVISTEAVSTVPVQTDLPTDSVTAPVDSPTVAATTEMPSQTPEPTEAATNANFVATPTLDPFSLPTPVINTPAPEIPDANIQIYQLGELSMVTSPLNVSLRVASRNGKVIRIDLLGEDGRLLARHTRTYNPQPLLLMRIGVPLDFEIRAAAEQGRLMVSVEDKFGRLVDIHSIGLLLLSQGVTQLNPSSGLWQRIIIQEPEPKMLIQGGRLIVSGRARPDSNQPLKVQLIGEDGKVLGQRLAGIDIVVPGDYGHFIAEVPYNVSELTNALVVVFEAGQPLPEILQLASIPVVLAP